VSFANPLPWWAIVLTVIAAAAVAWLAYNRRTLAPSRRATLAAIRCITLLALVLFLLRPVVTDTDSNARGAVAAILVDTSRSMSVEDAAGGVRRIDRARQIVGDRLLPLLSDQFHVEVLAFGDGVRPMRPDELSATARRSDVSGALAAVRERYRGRPIAGIILLSDGGDTSGAAEKTTAGGPRVYAVPVGAIQPGKDREILSVTAADAILDDSRVDLAVSAVSHGLGSTPIELRLLENGRPVDVRRVTPATDGSPVRAVFQVSPGRAGPTVYSVATPVSAGELVPENNVRSTLVQPPSRPRRVLILEGAPGFEHSFLKRALASDTGLEIDSVVRKGRNEQGVDTFYVQAARSRSDSLAHGFPSSREALFAYDTLVLGNVEGHQLTREAIDATRAFVSERGGGLLVLGARSFVRQGLAGTALEDVLPLDLRERGGDVVPASSATGVNRVALTSAGEAHPMMQLAPALEDTRKRWASIPALAGVATLGGPRPGASVLAVTSGSGGAPRALVAVQRFGEGRSMLFAGEASWRWRMLLPAADRSYDIFWKQAVRWLALPATDPIQLTMAHGAMPGDALALRVAVRTAAFLPLENATVDLRVTAPDGRVETLRGAPAAGREPGGRYEASFQPASAGVFRVVADVRQGATQLGTATGSVLVGGADLEMTDPRVNRAVLDRLATASGGRVLDEGQLSSLLTELKAAGSGTAPLVRRDLWHTGWSFATILVLLGTEWVLRRRWGLT
jgi:uncharacterized membrane protein